jgi:hypothetical protein
MRNEMVASQLGFAKYNLEARWLIRQTGIVRQHGEEFNPDELAYKPAEMGRDPDTGAEVLLTTCLD